MLVRGQIFVYVSIRCGRAVLCPPGSGKDMGLTMKLHEKYFLYHHADNEIPFFYIKHMHICCVF